MSFQKIKNKRRSKNRSQARLMWPQAKEYQGSARSSESKISPSEASQVTWPYTFHSLRMPERLPPYSAGGD